MLKRVIRPVLVCVLLCWQLPLTAQTPAAAIEEIVITPNRIPVPLRQIGISISVLDETDLQRHGSLSLDGALRTLPAVALSNTGGMGQTSSLFIRGEEGFRTLVLLDGIRLSDPSSTQIAPHVEQLLSSGVGRVEVLRGPQGLGYGADAGGIINISSQSPSQQLHANIEAQGGSYDTRQLGTVLGGGNDFGDFSLAAADFSTAGFNARTTDTVLRDNDGFDNSTLHLRGGLNLGEHWRAELVHHRIDATTQFDDCGFFVPENNCVSKFNQQASRAALSYQSDLYSHSLSFTTTTTDRDSLAGGSSVFATTGKLRRWDYVGSATVSKAMTLVFGADYENDAITGKKRSNRGYFGEVLGRLTDQWFVTLGARQDRNDDFGRNDSYRATTAYLVDTDAGTIKFKGSYGTGFRAPSPYEISYNQGPYSYPPASSVALQQERSKGYELGMEYSGMHGLKAEAVYFNQQVDNVIDFDLVSYSGYLQDLGRGRSHGVELSGAVALTESLKLQANYTWNHSERPDGSQRLRRPQQLANAGVLWQGPGQKLQLHMFGRVSRAAVDQGATGVQPLEDYFVLDAGGSYRLTSAVQLFARIENAFDERYQQVSGYRTAERAAYVGFRWSFAGR